ncbi:MAG: CDP-alcohol phosphatidyltransferase family protein, partial [Candidatus Omnitrophica bacterium]|nr:CDP-alcohol phosphatidyltransferase family protein [Candidatus Omnitrophota bacterium]
MLSNMAQNNNAPDNYLVVQNEISFLRRPMERLLKKIQRYDFITPNLLTAFSFSFSLAASSAILLAGYRWLIVSAVLIILSYLFDCADGRLARLKNMESGFGFWFDRITDQIKLSLIILALGLRAYYIDGQGQRILIIMSLAIIIQLIKELSWSIFEIFRLKTAQGLEYAQFVLDRIKIRFTRDSLRKRILFV